MAVGPPSSLEFFPVQGVRISTLPAQVKYPDRDDFVLIALPAGSSCAGVTTKNAFCAAPVHLVRKHLELGLDTRFLVINTGNANAGTGDQGEKDALAICQAVAQQFGAQTEQVLPFSTGVIGEYLPIDRMLNAIPKFGDSFVDNDWARAASGIMTTDTRPKGASVSVEYAGHTIAISGISKGAGMIKPNMATMLAFIATDARLSDNLIQRLAVELAETSFNRITVDGDTSTNDCCMLMSTQTESLPEIEEDHPDFDAFYAALQSVYTDLALEIIKDGEGATKCVSIHVQEALDNHEALEVAYTVAHSPLVKTALFASDANWGRILAAVGRAPIDQLELEQVDLFLDDVCIVENGQRSASYTEEAGSRVMQQESLTIIIRLGRGDAEETVWTNDLSHDYVSINADYRS